MAAGAGTEMRSPLPLVLALLLAPPGPAARAGSLDEIDTLLARGLYPDALAKLDAAEKSKPDVDRVALTTRRVDALAGLGRTEEAEKLLAAALAKSPKELELLHASADLDISSQGGDTAALARAAKTLETALALKPDHPRTSTLLGMHALAERRDADAVGHFLKVVETLNPKAFDAWHGLARAQIRLGRIDKARTAMRSCLDQGPSVAENHWMAGNVELASDEPGASPRALQSYLFAIGLADWIPKYKGWAIMTHLLMHDYGQAAILERLLKGESPLNSYLLVAEGIRSELKGDVVPARENYLRAVQADAANPWARWCLANIYLGSGNREFVEVAKMNPFFYAPFARPEAAAEHLQVLETLAPEFPFRAKVQAAIQRANALRDRSADPTHEKRVGELKRYLSAIRQSAARPKW